MPVIEVTLAEGRSPELKRALISALTAAVVDTGFAAIESVRVILREVPAEHFAAADVTIAERRAAAAAAAISQEQAPDQAGKA